MFRNHTENHGLYNDAREQRAVFFLVSMGVFSLTFAFFFAVDFLPEKPEGTTIAELTADVETTANPPVITDVAPSSTEVFSTEEIVPTESGVVSQTNSNSGVTLPTDRSALPIAIIFDTLNREVPVLNPESSTVAALDSALLKGVVRHPGSGDFVTKGTIFLLGHSSYLPNVINKNFQAFNGIQKLVWGDTIRLRSTETEYTYRVDRVYQTKATGAEIAIEAGKDTLTLATCNSFGSKDDRYIVEATLISTRAL